MDRGEPIFLHHPFGDEDGVLKVVAVPGHESDAHILTKRQLAQIHGRTVREHVTGRHHIALLYQRALVNAGVLVAPGVLGQAVDIDTRFPRSGFRVIDLQHNAGGIHAIDHAATTGHHAHATVAGNDAFNARTHEGLLRPQGRHRLALHVGPHERPVRVIMLEEGNERRRYGHHLLRRNVHVIDVFRGHLGEFVLESHVDEIFNKLPLVV